jgi:hypothetical protein
MRQLILPHHRAITLAPPMTSGAGAGGHAFETHRMNRGGMNRDRLGRGWRHPVQNDSRQNHESMRHGVAQITPDSQSLTQPEQHAHQHRLHPFTPCLLSL